MRDIWTTTFVVSLFLSTLIGVTDKTTSAWAQENVCAHDKTYGYTQTNPIKVGGVESDAGPLRAREFLLALRGPHGEMIKYMRKGSCCPFPSQNGLMGGGLLDMYQVTYEGIHQPILLYFNMYDYVAPQVPPGFSCPKLR